MIKFLHVLFAMSLLGLTAFCFAHLNSKERLQRMNKLILWVSPFAMLTGVLLVHPGHYTFHTLWIEDAISYLAVFMVSILFLILLKNKIKSRWILMSLYSLLMIVLMIITLDAIGKTSFTRYLMQYFVG